MHFRLASVLVLAVFLGLPGCRPGAARPRTTEAPPAFPDRSAEIERLLLRADLVVLGRVTLGGCRDGCRGRITIEEALVGTAAGTLDFTSEPPLEPVLAREERLIVFLARRLSDPSGWRLLLTDGRELGMEAHFRKAVAATRLPRAEVPEERALFAAELDQLRRHDQRQWLPSSRPALATARALLMALDFRGIDAGTLVELLGEPATRRQDFDHDIWQYTYHDGEQGLMPQFWFREGLVAAVILLRIE